MIIQAEPGLDHDAAYWTIDLLRMYARWADARAARMTMLECDEQPEKVVLAIEGRFAFGLLRRESGLHVRRPIEVGRAARARIRVLPDPEDLLGSRIRDGDLRIERFCAGVSCSGHRGVTLRVTHVPTGLVVRAGPLPSEGACRAIALRVLRAELAGRGIDAPGADTRIVRVYDRLPVPEMITR